MRIDNRRKRVFLSRSNLSCTSISSHSNTTLPDTMASLSSSASKFKCFTVLFLVANFAFNLNTIWGPLLRNGYSEALMQMWNDGPHVLPGSSNPILTTYTFIRPLDQLLTFSTVLFANITDGSTPQLSLFAFQFTGQWASIMTIIIMESLREGIKKRIVPMQVIPQPFRMRLVPVS